MRVVAEPTRETEFEVQATLYAGLRELGFNVRGEVNGWFDKDQRQKCRFDLAEFVDGELAGIIEVKSAPITHKTAQGWNGTRQGRRYGEWGVPVRVVYGMQMANELIEQARVRGSIW